tara:strand:- start:1823 stop:3010 length:1188 start_codon:yes stop_codon:yes gene_type:complete
MKYKNSFSWIYILLACAMLAIGRLYDERLEFFGINLSIILSVSFLLLSIPLLLSIKRVKHFNTKRLFYYFLLIIIILPPMLCLYFDYDTFGFEKYFNFIFIVIPLVIIVIETFKYNDVRIFFKILLGFIIVLSLIGLLVVLNSSDRLSVLGGGPIVFARWMNIGLIILFFIKQSSINKKSILLMLFFFVLSLAAGSRGPVLSLAITFAVYFFLNFQKVFLRVLFFSFLIASIAFFSGINTSILGIGKTERLVTKDNRSKNARMVFASRSFDLMSHYPLGVGLGNWQVYANKIKPTHLLKHQYPHNLVLEIFAELGIISGILFLILLLKILFYNYKKMYLNKNNEHSFYPLLFYLQFYLIINSFFSGSLNDSRLLFVVMAMSLIETPLILKAKKNV